MTIFGGRPVTMTVELSLLDAIQLLTLLNRYYRTSFGQGVYSSLELQGAADGKTSRHYHLHLTIEVAWLELAKQAPDICAELTRILRLPVSDPASVP